MDLSSVHVGGPVFLSGCPPAARSPRTRTPQRNLHTFLLYLYPHNTACRFALAENLEKKMIPMVIMAFRNQSWVTDLEWMRAGGVGGIYVDGVDAVLA